MRPAIGAYGPARPVVRDANKCFALTARAPHIAGLIIFSSKCPLSHTSNGTVPRNGFFMNEPTAESRETRLRRLVYQSSYTGMKETDLLLGRFAKLHLHGLSDDELGQYEALLDVGDDRIYAWVVAGEPAPQIHDNRVLDLIKEFKND